MMKIATILGALLLSLSIPVQAITIEGGVDKNEVLPQFNLKLMTPKLDNSGLSFKENCVCMNAKKVQKVNIDGRWKIVEGDHWLVDFGDKADAASDAVEAIKYYGFSQMCSFGKGGPSGNMQYFLVDGDAPNVVPISGEDAIPFDYSLVKAEQIRGTWKVTEGDHWMFDFGTNEESAKQAAEVLQHYQFKRVCYVGRPGSPMQYFVK